MFAHEYDPLPNSSALTRSRFREYNERVKPHHRAHVWVDPPMPDWVCECASEECSIAVPMTFDEYEAVRADPARFLVAPSDEHVVPNVERVVQRSERYWVVEKVGEAGVSEVFGTQARLASVTASTEAPETNAWNLPAARRSH